jgi:hypothetical protein
VTLLALSNASVHSQYSTCLADEEALGIRVSSALTLAADRSLGGVSLAGEEATMTARHEVAEELGLTMALEGIDTTDQQGRRLSEPLLRCVVCTGYNRCVVDLFCYTMNTATERVAWQVEEVAWGSFVPYSIVEAAADGSITRLAATNDWPGRQPPIQSQRQGDPPPDEDGLAGRSRLEDLGFRTCWTAGLGSMATSDPYVGYRDRAALVASADDTC